MGFTPLEGMIMGTRCGNVDCNVIPYIMKKRGLSPDEMTTIMNKKSGLIGLGGASSDMRETEQAAANGSERAKLAINKLTYDIVKLIGAYSMVLGGVDLIVFTAGIGEHNHMVRRRVCDKLGLLGVKLDYAANEKAFGEEALISAPDSKVKVALIPTEEELMIALDTMNIVSK